MYKESVSLLSEEESYCTWIDLPCHFSPPHLDISDGKTWRAAPGPLRSPWRLGHCGRLGLCPSVAMRRVLRAHYRHVLPLASCLARDPTPDTLHPTPYTLHPHPHPTPYTLVTLHPTPYTLHPSA